MALLYTVIFCHSFCSQRITAHPDRKRREELYQRFKQKPTPKKYPLLLRIIPAWQNTS
jgi:hypothetical protein